ncbi:MAG TPA: polyphenol oxidase family protein [Solirubrobacterales bacterium]|nr:polyphenol oxidase family protein [Solirubrobacterales bacterium]
MDWRERGGVRWLEAAMPGASAAFMTRSGGVSEPPFAALNLGIFTEDDREAVVENRHRLAASLGFSPERIAAAHQVHGADLIEHRGQPAPRSSFAWQGLEKEQCSRGGGGLTEGDGHIVKEEGVAALVFVADCVPVALSGPGGVAMLHCGWRGLAAGIIAKGVAAIGAADAVIGPSIGSCCYEVGDEVLAAFDHLGEGVAADRMLDLPEATRRLLAEAGVEQIETSGLCTSCESDLFFSHRRDRGRTGRQAGLVWRSVEEG